MGEVITVSIVSVLFIVIGVLISKYKCYWLISGYNTSSKEEKARVEIEKVAKHMGRMCYAIAIILFLGSVISKYYSISFFHLLY